MFLFSFAIHSKAAKIAEICLKQVFWVFFFKPYDIILLILRNLKKSLILYSYILDNEKYENEPWNTLNLVTSYVRIKFTITSRGYIFLVILVNLGPVIELIQKVSLGSLCYVR